MQHPSQSQEKASMVGRWAWQECCKQAQQQRQRRVENMKTPLSQTWSGGHSLTPSLTPSSITPRSSSSNGHVTQARQAHAKPKPPGQVWSGLVRSVKSRHAPPCGIAVRSEAELAWFGFASDEERWGGLRVELRCRNAATQQRRPGFMLCRRLRRQHLLLLRKHGGSIRAHTPR